MKGTLTFLVTTTLFTSFFLISQTTAESQHTAAPNVTVVRLDPRFDKLIPPNATVEKIADGFSWVEGPVWRRKENYLLFSDIPNNSIFKWQEGEGTSLFLKPSGYTGPTPFSGREPGSNGLAFDSDGRLILCEHGDRRSHGELRMGQRWRYALYCSQHSHLSRQDEHERIGI